MLENSNEPLIYIVDDDLSVRDSLRMLIESTGRNVRCFDSAVKFLNAFDPDFPGCVILDIWMPGMTGLEVQQELAKRNITIPVIFISGMATISLSSMAFRLGAADFFEKPVDSELLLTRIDQELRRFLENYHEKRHFTTCFNSLTSKEKEYFLLMIKGLSNKEIAKVLGNNHRTLEAYRAKVIKKMQVKNLHELITLAARFGFFDGKIKR